MEKKVCLIVPYFGQFPNYFKFWLRSCEHNRQFDWIIFTDNELVSNAPNIIIYHYTWNEICKYIQSKFDFEITLNQPYKLCDFRPAYGLIFEDYIKIYHFWGYCDVDIVWGDLQTYITDNILNNYDRIFQNGHFCLYRNIDRINRLFQKDKGIKYNYKYIFTHPNNFVFDENGIPIRSRIKELLPFFHTNLDPFNSLPSLGGCNTLAKEYNIKQYKNIVFDDVRQNQFSFFSTRKIGEYSLRESKKMPAMFSYSKGKLYRIAWTPVGINTSETMYVHFQKRPMKISTINTDNYSIIPNKFIDTPSDIEQYKRMCHNRIIYWHYWKLRFKNLIKKIKTIKIKKEYQTIA